MGFLDSPKWARLVAESPSIKGVFSKIHETGRQVAPRNGLNRMRPLTVVTGILLGSCLSIMLSLAAVMLVFLLLNDQYPRLDHEFRPLALSLLLFTAMTAISALSFYFLLREHALRWPAQAAMWAGLAATGWYYWP